jgi:hypothetical protein
VKPFCDEELEDFLIQEPEENCGGLLRLNPVRDGDGLSALQWWVQSSSNGNASETKAKESYDNGVFFHIEANTFDSKQIIFETKQIH